MTDRMTRRRLLAATGAAAATTVAPAAAAQSDSESAAGLWEDATFTEQAVATGAFLKGFVTGVDPSLPGLSDQQSVDDYVSGTVSEFEAHTDDWLTWVNDRGYGGPGRQSLEVNFQLSVDRRTRYVLATYDDAAGEYSSVRISESFDGEADETATLRNKAVRNAETELTVLHDRYIGPNEDIDIEHRSYLAGKYYTGSTQHVTSSLLGGQ